MMAHQIKEWVSPFLDKPLDEHAFCCPLHFFAFGRFKQVLLESGYEIAHPEGVFFNRQSRDLIYNVSSG